MDDIDQMPAQPKKLEENALEAINGTHGYRNFDPANDWGTIQPLGILESRNKVNYPQITKYIMKKPIEEVDGVTQIKEIILGKEETSTGQLDYFWNENSAPYTSTLKDKIKHVSDATKDVLYTVKEQYILKCHYRKYLAILFGIQILHHNNLLISYTDDCDKEEYLNSGRRKSLLNLGYDLNAILNHYDLQIQALTEKDRLENKENEIVSRKNNIAKIILIIISCIFVIPIIIILCLKLYRWLTIDTDSNIADKHLLIANERTDFQNSQRVDRIVQLGRATKAFRIKYTEAQRNNVIQKIEDLTIEDIKIKFFRINDQTDIEDMDANALNALLKTIPNSQHNIKDENGQNFQIAYFGIECKEEVQLNTITRNIPIVTITLQIQTSNPDAVIEAFQERAQGLEIDFKVERFQKTQNGLIIDLHAYEDEINNRDQIKKNIIMLFSRTYEEKYMENNEEKRRTINVTQEEIERIIHEEFSHIIKAKNAVIRSGLTNTKITYAGNDTEQTLTA